MQKFKYLICVEVFDDQYEIIHKTNIYTETKGYRLKTKDNIQRHLTRYYKGYSVEKCYIANFIEL